MSIPGALPASSVPLGNRQALRAIAAYGVFAMPLAMAAIPLYVHLPRFYGESLGVGLVTLGAVLLAMRLLDAVLDPLLGAWSDRIGNRRTLIACAAPVLAIGLVALFMPPVRGETALVAWLCVSLALVYAAFSLATINHGAWGAELSSDPVERTRITALRESLALIGVVVASVAPALLGGGDEGLSRFAIAFAAFISLCIGSLWLAPLPRRVRREPGPLFAAMARPLRDRMFRNLLGVFMLNGIASAIPATLVLFFVADVLGEASRQGWFLALYFVAGAAGMPLWVRLSVAWGKPAAWSVSMLVAVASFVWAAFLTTGDGAQFAVICALSGCALGADLALPPSMLADVIGRRESSASAGAYFGVWTLATKLNLAIAAGVALPLLATLGYVPGAGQGSGVTALAAVYAALPCVLKLAALAALAAFARTYRRIA